MSETEVEGDGDVLLRHETVDSYVVVVHFVGEVYYVVFELLEGEGGGEGESAAEIYGITGRDVEPVAVEIEIQVRFVTVDIHFGVEVSGSCVELGE